MPDKNKTIRITVTLDPNTNKLVERYAPRNAAGKPQKSAFVRRLIHDFAETQGEDTSTIGEIQHGGWQKRA